MGRAVLGQNQNVTTQDVIHIDALLRQHIDIRDVAGRALEFLINSLTPDDKCVIEAKFAEFAFERRCLTISFKSINNDELTVAGFA